jgi:voltage-gated potassium channel
MAATADASAARGSRPLESPSYNIFMLVLTVFSLAIMVLLLLPLDDATLAALTWFDNAICLVFLADFSVNLASASPKREYLIDRRGWLDLLGSIPSLGFLRAAGLLRIARLSRLARATRMLRGTSRKELFHDVVTNRGQYALLITVLAAFLVLSVSTILMIQFESRSADANITTGGDALWWSFATITTVGYGDQFPVTGLGRTVAVFVMFAGVGIIGSLASILASVLVPSPAEPADGMADDGAVAQELAALRVELAALRVQIENRAANPQSQLGDQP